MDSDSDEETQRQQAQPLNIANLDEHPLFWDVMPDNPEDHPVYAAMQAIDDELTPLERAEGLKNEGNNKLKMALHEKADAKARKNILEEAIKFYSDGLATLDLPKKGDRDNRPEETKLGSIILSNRAHVESLRGNWRNALEDSIRSIGMNSINVKPYFRGARAALKLRQYAIALQLCDAGEELDPSAVKELGPIRQEAEKKMAAQLAAERAAREEEEKVVKPARALADALVSRGYQITTPQVSTADAQTRPSLQEDGSLVFPVVLMYPEVMTQDSIQAFHEDDTIADHLDMMFGPAAPPLEWDDAKQYTRDKLELYYLANVGKPLSRDQLVDAMRGRWPEGLDQDADRAGPKRYGPDAACWVRIDERKTLRDVLSEPGCVVAGVPLFMVVASGTEYRERFLQQQDR